MSSDSSLAVAKHEWRFVGTVALVLLTLTSLPYLWAYVSAPRDRHFVGFILDVPDHAQYLAWYRAFQGGLLVSNTLTPEPNPPLFFNLLWWTLAQFGYYSGLSYAAVYQVFRWLAGAFLLTTIYAFVGLTVDDVQRRRTAFLVVTLGGGLGWMLIVLKYTLIGELWFPLDVYIAEGNSFLCILAFPHFAAAAGLIVAIFCILIIGEQRPRRWRYPVGAGLLATGLGWQHGYDLLMVWGIPAAYVLARFFVDQRLPVYWIRALCVVVALSWPPALYAVWLTRANAMWAHILEQFANAGVYSPTPAHMFILMGIPLLCTVLAVLWRAGWFQQTQALMTHELFVVTWFVAGWLLAYVPANFQVHMLNGWQVPIGLLATTGWFAYAIPALERRWAWPGASTAAAVALVALVIPVNLYLFAWRFYDLGRHDYPYYLHADESAALGWVDAHAPPDAVVLSAEPVGRFVPGLTGTHAFLAHFAQTTHFYEKRRLVAQFFARDTSEEWRRRLLQQYGVGYVLYGPAERGLGAYVPDRSKFLRPVFSAPDARVYAVEFATPTGPR
jgi:hypothetical protein